MTRLPFAVAARSLMRAPEFALTAILTLALGIGLSTAVFTVADALLIRRLPVGDQDRLVVLWTETREQTANWPFALDDVREMARRRGALETCMSARPGRSHVLPRPSMVRAPRGIATWPSGPTRPIVPPDTTTTWWGRMHWQVIGIRLTSRKATVPLPCPKAARVGTTKSKAISEARAWRDERSMGLPERGVEVIGLRF